MDPDSLYPWRPDRTYLLEFRLFTFLIILWHNKILFHSFYFLRSVLLYVGQSYYENDIFRIDLGTSRRNCLADRSAFKGEP
ncbi:hypothetical protein AMECASPLE_028554 [Ameca splendens]|uniref:Uncharacterized protein n=1 Tax=Ameca splendens TaxID=208324 RepID=A0ABV0XUH3_9TELE